MGFNPFPWHRPTEDRRARAVERFVSPGLGRRPPPDRPTIAMVFALVAGVGIPLAMLLLLLTGLPWWTWAAAGAAVVAALASSVARSRAASRRAAERARQREERVAAPP